MKKGMNGIGQEQYEVLGSGFDLSFGIDYMASKVENPSLQTKTPSCQDDKCMVDLRQYESM